MTATGVRPGYDLVGAFIGSEGTLGIVDQGRRPADAGARGGAHPAGRLRHHDEGGAAVAAIIAAGIVPAAIEMMDALAIEAAEAAVHCDYPAGAGAVLVVELDGPAAEVEAELADGPRDLREGGRVRDPGRPTTRPSGR